MRFATLKKFLDMKFLLLGYSRIARRRVIPALKRIGIRELDVASVSVEAMEQPQDLDGRWFRDYEQALAESNARVVYISTTNNLHAKLATQALRRGFHVVVDKPACLNSAEAGDLAEVAQSTGLCLAEATVWGSHPQVLKALDYFPNSATRILSAFSFPPLPANDYRYRADLGGGALYDVGPYAITPARLFFGQPALEMEARALSYSDGVITSFSLLAVYPQGRCLTGFFGFTTSYANQLQILGPHAGVALERVFSPPADLALRLTVRERDVVRNVDVAAGDTFEVFIREVLVAIRRRDYERFRETLLFDAGQLEQLGSALSEGSGKGA